MTDVIYAFPVDETKAMATLRTDGELVAESHTKEDFYIGRILNLILSSNFQSLIHENLSDCLGTVFGTALDIEPVNETGQKQQFDWINQRR